MNCATKENSERQDYRIYRFSKKELLLYGASGWGVSALLLYFFYQSIWGIAAGIFGGIFYCKWKQKQLCEKRKYELEQEFKDFICNVDLGLQAGHSIENAFLKAGREIRLFYEADAMICKEAYQMQQQLNNHVVLEKILWDFAERSGLEDIRNFAEVFTVGKRSGGNIREMIAECIRMIVRKNEIEREIRLLIHGKVMEQKIMCLVPFGVISYISLSSPGYFTPLYHNPAGIGIMTICLLLYLSALWMSVRIVRIGV